MTLDPLLFNMRCKHIFMNQCNFYIFLLLLAKLRIHRKIYFILLVYIFYLHMLHNWIKLRFTLAISYLPHPNYSPT